MCVIIACIPMRTCKSYPMFMTIQDGRSFYSSNPSTLSPLLGMVTWCAFGISWFFVTCLTLIKTTFTYPRILAVVDYVLRIWTHNLSSHIHFLPR
ncbi:uncharacterized protein LOC126875454 isoform X2 [Bombus huntii]|uniref:uncharacterized protein LOC126875454 isoform X2 n=1 Tax=Bombus huntii TaxID=85661 RepID=UPI0021A993FA|nr:uncharacterized protein LOC126875454 isoform X2 [Bombus huntii]